MQIDWATLAFQTVNVAILVWLLARVFWRPMATMIARRKEEVAQVLSEAEATRAEATETAQATAKEREEIEAEREAMLAAAREAAEAQRQEILDRAEEEARARESAAAERIEAGRAVAEAAYAERAADLAVEMAARIGRHMDGPALRAAALEALASEIAALPEADRSALRANGDLTVVSAADLAGEEREEVTGRLAKALGGGAALQFRSDPQVVAGLEVETAHMTIGETWRDSLSGMRREIGHDR